MNKSVLVAASIAIAAVVIFDGSELPVQPGDVAIEPTKAIKIANTKGYGRKYRQADGGIVWRLATPDCVRSPAGVNSCRWNGKVPGDLNRFPLSEMTGTGCEVVACSVVAGENADLPEDQIIAEEVITKN